MSDEGPKGSVPPKRWRTIADILRIQGKGATFWEGLAITAFAIGTLTIMTFSLPCDGGWWRRSGLMFAVAIGAWISGGALGFLFGVPRYKSTPEGQNSLAVNGTPNKSITYLPNTNLDQVSDWLTKLILGATLVQLEAIKEEFSHICWLVAASLNQKDAAVFCGGIIVFFFLSGFMWGYLWCSIKIFREFNSVEDAQ